VKFAQVFQSRRRPVVSFEVFPPKTDAAMESFRAVLPRLVELRLDFVGQFQLILDQVIQPLANRPLLFK